MLDAPDHTQRTAYYAAALAGLRFVEQRRPTDRRFGRDADARWSAFRGHLETSDRIDLLIRDADAQWPRSFGARTVFGFRAVAEDDAFGSEWRPLEPVHGEEVWRGVLAKPAPADVSQAIEHCAREWQLALTAMDAGPIAPADKLLVIGPSAIAAAIRAFLDAPGLDFADQVVVVATPPAHRQLAALASAFLNLTRPTDLRSPRLDSRPAGNRRVLVSDDADPVDTEWVG